MGKGKNKSLLEFLSKRGGPGAGALEAPPGSKGGNAKDEKSLDAAGLMTGAPSPKEFQGGEEAQYEEETGDRKLYRSGELIIEVLPGVNPSEPRTIRVLPDRNVAEVVEGAYLMQVDYDGEAGKVLLIFYDENSHTLIYWYDKTGHKPYFLVDVSADKVSRIASVVRHPSFDHVEVVERYDPLLRTRRTMTKIVVKDPLAVRGLRDKVPAAWEADIRYHINYIYDLQLVPGMPYRARGDRIEEAAELDRVSVTGMVSEVVEAPSKDLADLAEVLVKSFEAKWFSPRRIAIDIEVFTPHEGRIPSPSSAEYPVMSIAVASNDGHSKVFLLFRENVGMGQEDLGELEVEIYDNEFGLLLDFLALMHSYPIILTFNGDNFDLRYILTRLIKLGLSPELAGIKVKEVVRGGKVTYEAKLRGSLHVDLYKFFSNKAVQNYAFEGSYKDVNLDSVAQVLLGLGKVQLELDISRSSLSALALYNARDAQITLQLTTFSDELVWKLILLLMRISKLGLEDLTRSTVSAWIKNLFYWEHRRRGYLIPRSEDIRILKGRKVTEATVKGKKYAGAIVIEPPQGLFFNVVVLDFASLYPSIMKRWNLSYETVDVEDGCHHVDSIVDERGNVIHTVCRDLAGLTALIVGLLRDLRVRVYKRRAKDKSLSIEVRSWYDVVQRALKVFINAAYGVFGAETFPLYAPSVAESVTALGRMIITATIDRAKMLGLQVLYGDTDSLFIWSPDQEVLEELRRWVWEKFGLEMEVDKVYKFVAFALKKNYVGVTSSNEIVVKGMMGKKRNTPDFIKELFVDTLRRLSTIEEPEDAFKVINDIRAQVERCYILLKYKLLPLDKVAFRTALTKPLSEYKKTTPQHVKAALLLQKHGVQISPGDVISYIKVKSREGVKPIQLSKVAEIDVQKYVETLRSTLEQLFAALNINWEDIAGEIKALDVR